MNISKIKNQLLRISGSVGSKFKIQSYLRHIKIRNRLMLSFLIISLIPVSVIGVFSSVYTLNNMENRTKDYSINITRQIVNNISYVLDNYKNKFERIALNTMVQKDLLDYYGAEYNNKVEIENRMWLTVSSSIGFDAGIDTVEVCSNQGQRFYYSSPVSKGKFEKSTFIKEALQQEDTVWKVSRKEIESDPKRYIILSKKIMERNNQVSGVAFMAINKEFIDDLCQKNSKNTNSSIVLTDQHGYIISHPDQNRITEYYEGDILYRINLIEEKRAAGKQVEKYFKTDSHDGEFLVSYDILPGNKWRVINLIPYSYLMKTTQNQVRITICIAGLIIMFSIIFSLVVTKSIHTPIYNLLNVMEKVGHGDLNVKVLEESDPASDEHAQLAYGFNDMVFKVKNLINDVYKSDLKKKELESHKKEAELNALQQQINPHFLYNTLESMYWSAQLRGDDEIGDIITALGNFFRASISKGIEYVTFEKEIENVNTYLFLQKVRFNERINVTWDISEEILKLISIKLFLQPFIEAAIIHGIECLEGTAFLHIKIYKEEGHVYVEITGNCVEVFKEGTGLSETSSDIPGWNLYENIGMENANQRIKLYFGDSYGVRVSRNADTGTMLSIVLPVLYEKPLSSF